MAEEQDKKVLEAILMADIAAVRIALAAGANVHARDAANDTSLHWAARYIGSDDIAALLLEHGAEINAKGDEGNTPLHDAIVSSNSETARLLIKRNADINAADENGRTPLHVAASTNLAEIVQLFIELGASVDVKDNSGGTPLHSAANANMDCTQTGILLLERGADPAIRNNEGKTAAALAKEEENDSLAAILEAAEKTYTPPLGPHSRRIKAEQTQQTWDEGI